MGSRQVAIAVRAGWKDFCFLAGSGEVRRNSSFPCPCQPSLGDLAREHLASKGCTRVVAQAQHLLCLNQHLAILGSVRGSHEAVPLHRLDDACGAIVAERELSLEP